MPCVPQASAEVTHRVSHYPSANRCVYLGRTVLTDTAGPCHPGRLGQVRLQDSSVLGFPQALPPWTASHSHPHSLCLQTSCRPTPSQTEDFSYIMFLALLPPASPLAKKFFYQWEAESSFKNREILSRRAQGRHGCRCGNGQPAFTAVRRDSSGGYSRQRDLTILSDTSPPAG